MREGEKRKERRGKERRVDSNGEDGSRTKCMKNLKEKTRENI